MINKAFSRAAVFILVFCIVISSIILNVGAVGVLPEKNSCARHILCTSLSDMAKAYYSGKYSYDKLSLLHGAADTSASDLAMRDNPLFDALHELMTDTHSYYPKYSGKKAGSLAYFWESTDCVDGIGSYTMFYSDAPAQGDYQMNREHIWPKSRASFYTSLGGADLHHLRPAVDKINNAKSNHTFGYINGTYSSGYTEGVMFDDVMYYLNLGEDLFECKDGVKGDVARILLYVYCRWEQPNLYSKVTDSLPAFDPDDDANSGEPVIESLDTLLQWCMLDPVDTWEMERNDLTQEIQGNRNVFIDYPELAWRIFDEEPPEGMSTPTHTGCGHHFEEVSRTSAKCEDEGSYTMRCSACGCEYTRRIAPAGHIDADDDELCDLCGTELVIFADMKRADTLCDGDHLALYHPSTGLTIGKNIGEKPNTVPAKIRNGVFHPSDDTSVFIVRYADDEAFYLTYGGQYLSCGESGGDLFLSDDPTEYSLWRLTPAASAGKYHIDSVNAQKDGSAMRLEIYSKNATVYPSGTTPAFCFELYTFNEHYYDDGVFDSESGNIVYTCRLCGEKHEQPAHDHRLIGDVDGDGDITVVDATVFQRVLAEIPVPLFISELADTDADGDITITDVTCIQYRLADIPVNSVVGQLYNDKQ